MLNALRLWFHLIFIPTHGVSLGFLLDLRWHKEMPYLDTYICTHTRRQATALSHLVLMSPPPQGPCNNLCASVCRNVYRHWTPLILLWDCSIEPSLIEASPSSWVVGLPQALFKMLRSSFSQHSYMMLHTSPHDRARKQHIGFEHISEDLLWHCLELSGDWPHQRGVQVSRSWLHVLLWQGLASMAF